MILGTAGHIDHGKTALVHALTGVDTDRLPEEKRRGITIDLGFAPLHLDGVGTLGVVDVPGHEAFVHTMVAGATGIDLALLAIAADEGVMPQTREHLAILDLLGVGAAVIALTKTDLVDPEWLRLVEDEAREAVAGSALEKAAIVPVSVKTGDGLAALRSALREVAASVHPPADDDVFRMPIDRVFTLRGTGTVVTGTVWTGELRRGPAWIHPPGRSARVRDLQSHGSSVDTVRRGMRAAVALADLAPSDLSRGALLVSFADWPPTRTLRATIELLPGVSTPGPRSRLRLHIGSAEVSARLVQLGRGQVRIHLDEAILCRAGDRFVVRGAAGSSKPSGAQVTTLGGGVVLDPFAQRRARRLPVEGFAPLRVLRALAAEQGVRGLELRLLPIQLGLPASRIQELLELPEFLVTDERVYGRDVLEATRQRLISLVERAHLRAPLESGLSVQEGRSALGVHADLFECVLESAQRDRLLEASDGFLRAQGWRPRLSDVQSRLAEEIMHAFCSATDPTTERQLVERFGQAALPVLRHLERDGVIVRLGGPVLAPPALVGELIGRLRASMAPGRGYSPAELRDALGVSRKVLIPLLEYCDRVQVTARRGSERVLRG